MITAVINHCTLTDLASRYRARDCPRELASLSWLSSSAPVRVVDAHTKKRCAVWPPQVSSVALCGRRRKERPRSFARCSRPVDAPQAAGRLRRLFRQRARAAPRTRARAPTRHNLQSKAGPRTLRQRVRAGRRPGARETRALRDVLTRVKTARRSEQSSRARVRLTRRRATRSSKRSVSEREAQPAPKRCTDTQHTDHDCPCPDTLLGAQASIRQGQEQAAEHGHYI